MTPRPDGGGRRFPFPESPLLPPETETERFLYSLTRFGMKPGLANIEALAARFGHPERRLRFLHVAGSNGKGSVCCYLESLLRAAGYRTGLFTSPHVLHVGERLRVDGRSLDDAGVAVLTERVADAVREREATFFETLTLMALLHFEAAGVDWVLWETGLGGRLDSTRVAPAEASVLTTISREHTRYLGTTLAEIAREKLAIGRPGRPFHVGLRDPALVDLARAEAARAGFSLRLLDEELPHRLDGGDLVVDPPGPPAPMGAAASADAAEAGGAAVLAARLAGRYPLPGLPAVQARNAALALAVLADLEIRRGECLLPGDPAAALAATALPARFHRVQAAPPLVLDGAHNPEALAGTLAAWDALAGERGVTVFGCNEDKEVAELLALLTARPRRVVLTAARQPRALAPEILLERAAAGGESAAAVALPGGSGGPAPVDPPTTAAWRAAPDLAAALQAAGEDAPVLVTGSFYLAAEAYHLLGIDPWS
ncbi:MAG: hypothetical protein JW819_03480 [Candidatus Krumholzibacteriota bacterium]|nr:hypothetical protein [Candidatus Krumholzibacteriota bacterium]